jgi:hypothetical protein
MLHRSNALSTGFLEFVRIQRKGVPAERRALWESRQYSVMSQAGLVLKPTPVVQDIPNFESTETGYTAHDLKRTPANIDALRPL